jgi:hypothetical protein
MTTQIANVESNDQILAFHPEDHPGFRHCTDPPRESPGRDSASIPVPSLVYLLHVLGGPGNISDELDDRTNLRTERGKVLASAWIVGRNPDGGCSLSVEEWHNYNSALTVIFGVPPRWHVDDWAIEHVGLHDKMSASVDFDVQVARLCDRTVGQNLAAGRQRAFVD